jgi:uncharacterized integral membrane protein
LRDGFGVGALRRYSARMAPGTRNRLQWAIIVLLLLVIAVLAFKFIVVGSDPSMICTD